MSTHRETVFAGRYRVVGRLGTGGTAAVFLARDERLEREVAVKRLHGAEVTAATAERLRREARIMASLRHPNLVTVYDMLTDEDDLLLAMEYVPGETLADVLVRAPLEWERVVELLTPVAAALDYVHAEGVVHRDVKPSNVLVGSSGVIKITDLGLATAAEITRITPPGSIVGTPAYMAPEQARAIPSCTGAADIYALATIAFQALSGKLPRAGSTVIAVLAQATRQPPPDLRVHRPDAPAAAAQALVRAMSADPDARHASASRLIDELREAYEAGRRAVPREPAPARPERRNVRARLLASAALVLVAAAVIAVVVTAGRDGSRPAPAPANSTATATAKSSATAAATATATPTPRAPRALSPTQTIRDFYRRAAAGDYAGAWKLAGPGMRAAFGGSFEQFGRDMSTLRRIEFQRLAITQRGDGSATVAIESTATHSDHVDRCSGTLRTVRAGGRWVVEPAGVSCTRG